MKTKITGFLALLAIISIALNMFQFVQSQQLRLELDTLIKENTGSQENSGSGPTDKQSTTGSNNNDNNDNAKAIESGGDTSGDSITAVAVRPIIISDGFFQSTEYEGAVMQIELDIKDGKGLVLVNTEIPTGVDFQTSARTAVEVAKSIVPSAALSSKDLIFSITSKSQTEDLMAVDGPSAGAAMAALLISQLQGTKLDKDVLITGTIERDGTIGRIGGVPEKAMTAGKHGAEIFLVPKGQGTYQDETCTERQQGLIIYRTCTAEQKPISEITEKTYGMRTIEVQDIKQALQYLQSKV